MPFLKKHGCLRDTANGKITWTRNGNENAIGYIMSLENSEDKVSFIQLIYTKTDNEGNKENLDYKIPLITTSCNYGGKRYWFVCALSINGRSCARKVGVLYKPYYAKYFGCRNCYNLTYASRNLNGIEKVYGGITSIPELEKMESEIKKEYYRGQLTRKYKTYLKKSRSNKIILGTKMAKAERILQRFDIKR